MNTIEVYHLRHTTGRKYVAVFQDRFDTPVMKEYMEEYHAGLRKPHYPLPAIPLEVHWPDTGYAGMVYIDDITDPNDPVIVRYWDYYTGSGQ